MIVALFQGLSLQLQCHTRKHRVFAITLLASNPGVKIVFKDGSLNVER